MQPRRLEGIYYDYPTYYLTLVACNRNYLFANSEVHASIIAFAERAVDHGVSVGRYVMMPDHIHLFAAFAPESISLSDWIKSLKNSLSKCLRSTGHRPPHWQKGFFDRVLRGEESYGLKWEYVRNNPVRSGYVDQPDDWPFQGQICDLTLDQKNGRS
jgi:REP element-mobilizing transposase RayT